MSLNSIPIETNPLSLPSHTQYKALERKFTGGRTVEIGELKGWYTGRCFFADAPSRAVATLLAADSETFRNTNGPAFASAEYRHITPLVDTTAVATKFDSAPNDIAPVLKKSRALNAFPVRQNDEMVVQGYRTRELESRVYRLRKSGGYLTLKLECAEHSYCSNFSGWISNKFLAYEGEAVAYCYYFKKVR
jgi:hypothetical protein